LKKVLTVRDDAPFRIAITGVPEAAGAGVAESFALIPSANHLTLRASDARGLVYAITDVAQRAGQENFGIREPIIERPANPVRSVARFLVSDVEEKPWYTDREFWRQYLTMLVSNRVNRVNLTLGMRYDFARHMRDCHFH